MKKLLTVSLVAVMAVSAAHADIASTQYVSSQISNHGDVKASASEYGHVKIGDGIAVEDGVISVNANSIIGDLQDGSITNAMIAADAVTSDKIKDLEVKTADIDNLAVTTEKLAADAVTTDKIKDLEVKTADIDNLAVTNAKLAADAVTTDKIANSTIKIEDLNSEVTDLMNGHEVVENKLTGETVSSTDLTADKYMSALTVDSFVNAKIATVSSNTDKMIGDLLDVDKNDKVDNFEGTSMENDKDIVSALVTLDDVKQDKSAVAYQIGTSDGGWVSLVASLPDNCKTTTSVCSLVATGGKLSWEVIAGQEANDETITTSVISETADAE